MPMLSLLASCICFQGVTHDVAIRVERLLNQMTTEEKIEMLSGIRDFYTRPVERLGIRSFKMSDGPAGVRTFGRAPAYPAPIGMAATWDRDLMMTVGQSYGRDARLRDVDFLLAPGVNIYRVPMNGRNFEYFGEDPYLASQVTVPFIKGVQSQGVIATVKHFAANNQEFDRTGTSSNVDERTLREIYFPAFEAAVKEGGVWAVMCSYNLLNGQYASENDWLLNKVLKRDWKFKGLVMSDWGATHHPLRAALGGLDLEMPGGDHFTQTGVGPLVRSGQISQAVLDDKVRRLLTATMAIGAFDRKPVNAEVKDDAESGQVALEVARRGIVLLKNQKGILPLRSPKRIAVIGPNGDPAVVGGGGSSQTTPFSSISPFKALTVRAGSDARVEFVSGALPDISRLVSTTRFDGPLKVQYFTNKSLQGTPLVERNENGIDNLWTGSPAPGVGATTFSVRWTGTITPSESGEFEFQARGDDGYRVYLDDKPIIDEWRDQGPFSVRATANLLKGKSYRLRVEYYQAGGGAEIRLGWGKVTSAPYEEAAAAAKNAEIAIVCIGLAPAIEHEGDDRPFSLPRGQDELVQAVVKANPNTIVVLNGGGAVDMRKWIDRVPALVMAWYPGQNGNQALAEILFGDISPSGKLPISIAKRWEDCESYGNYPGADHKVEYKEGVFVGYRHFDRGKAKPLFPFGFGLTYSTFKYSNLAVEQRAFGETLVRFDVQNTGKFVADEIAQVYVTPAPAPVPRPAKELKGFLRVRLQPGEKKTLVVRLDPRAFSFFHVRKHEWEVERGDYGILVGSSNRDIKLRGKVTWAEKYEIGPEEDDDDHDRKPPPR